MLRNIPPFPREVVHFDIARGDEEEDEEKSEVITQRELGAQMQGRQTAAFHQQAQEIYARLCAVASQASEGKTCSEDMDKWIKANLNDKEQYRNEKPA